MATPIIVKDIPNVTPVKEVLMRLPMDIAGDGRPFYERRKTADMAMALYNLSTELLRLANGDLGDFMYVDDYEIIHTAEMRSAEGLKPGYYLKLNLVTEADNFSVTPIRRVEDLFGSAKEEVPQPR